MNLQSLSLWDLRNVEKQEISFSPGINLLYGPNAQGKTNAVEAVYYLAALKSFRCPKYREMIAHSARQATIQGRIALSDREVTLSCTLPRTGRRTVEKNGVKPQKLSEFLGVFRAVLFCPEHLRLVKDGPGERRSFLDGAICQLKPTYASVLNEFNRLSAQRSALFRQYGQSQSLESLLEPWDRAYAKVSVKISQVRKQYAQALGERARQIYYELSGHKEELELSYSCDVDPDTPGAGEEFLLELKKNRAAEQKNLFCPKGAHKDDLILRLDGRSARFFASQGQQRSVVLSLKLAEGQLSRDMTGEAPVFLLDDVLSELDERRRAYILASISTGQVILTSCDPAPFFGLESLRRIRVEQGSFTCEE